jgi:hypothetical protein
MKPVLQLSQNQTKTHAKRRTSGKLLNNINTKILSELMANLIQQCIRIIIQHDHVGFITGCRDGTTYTNQ